MSPSQLVLQFVIISRHVRMNDGWHFYYLYHQSIISDVLIALELY